VRDGVERARDAIARVPHTRARRRARSRSIALDRATRRGVERGARAMARERRRDDVTLPRATKLALIRFPGYVDDVDACERMLGGRAALSEACFPRETSRRRAAGGRATSEDGATTGRRRRDGGRLELRFANANANAKAKANGRRSVAYGERRETRSIVLKMTERADANGGTRTEVEAIGLARRVFLFRGAADFGRRNEGRDDDAGRRDAVDGVKWLKDAKGGANDPFELGNEGDGGVGGMGATSLRPPLYTRDDIPVANYFEQNDTGATTTREVDFHEIAVPTRGLAMEDASSAAVSAMRALMEERDVWAPLAALARLPKSLADEIVSRKLHATTCYQFSSGPFKKSWIKVGVDPRFDRTYVRHQTVTLRLPANWFRDDDEEGARRKERFSLSSRADRGYHAAIHGFRAIPDARHPVLSLADIDLPSVRAAVERAATCEDPPSACDERRGWLSAALHRKIQRAILRGYQTLLNGGDPIAVDEASMADADDAAVDDDFIANDAAAPKVAADDDEGDEYEILAGDDDSGDDDIA
jgi:hypothetical protein